MSEGHDNEFELHAWIDESIHLDAGNSFYVLAAAVGDPSSSDMIRDQLRALVPGRRPRLHWHKEEGSDRLIIVDAVGKLDLAHLVVVGSPVSQRKQERARRKCAELLFHRLSEMGVSQAFIEARTPTQNQKDMRMVRGFRGAKTIAADPRVDFARPLEEPMLWVPDAVAGAVAAARKGTLAYRDLLGSGLEELTLDLD